MSEGYNYKYCGSVIYPIKINSAAHLKQRKCIGLSVPPNLLSQLYFHNAIFGRIFNIYEKTQKLHSKDIEFHVVPGIAISPMCLIFADVTQFSKSPQFFYEIVYNLQLKGSIFHREVPEQSIDYCARVVYYAVN